MENKEKNYDLDGRIVLGKSGEGKFVPLKVNQEGELIIQGGGGGGGDFPSPHEWTHLPDGSDPLPIANTERYGLTKTSNAIDSQREDISASSKAVNEVQINVNRFTDTVSELTETTNELTSDVMKLKESEEKMKNDIIKVGMLANENEQDIISLEAAQRQNEVTFTSIQTKVTQNETDIKKNTKDISDANVIISKKMDADRPSNIVENGSGFLKFSGWNNIGIGNFLTAKDGSGIPYLSFENATTNSHAILESNSFNVFNNETYNISAEMYQLGQIDAIWIEVLNVIDNTILTRLNAKNSATWERINVDFKATATTLIKLRLVVNINKTSSFKGWRRVQITLGSGVKAWNIDGDFSVINDFQKWKLTTDTGNSKNITNLNANNFKTSGSYAGNNIQNMPDTGYWYLDVQTYFTNDFVVQTARGLFSNIFRQRIFANEAWGSWSSDMIRISELVIPGAGSPEGVITAPVGRLYLRTDGGVNTTLYVKQTGNGNTGWSAK